MRNICLIIKAHLKQAPDMGGIKEDYIDNIQQN
jgi:predicted small metal-binding protein